MDFATRELQAYDSADLAPLGAVGVCADKLSSNGSMLPDYGTVPWPT